MAEVGTVSGKVLELGLITCRIIWRDDSVRNKQKADSDNLTKSLKVNESLRTQVT